MPRVITRQYAVDATRHERRRAVTHYCDMMKSDDDDEERYAARCYVTPSAMPIRAMLQCYVDGAKAALRRRDDVMFSVIRIRRYATEIRWLLPARLRGVVIC